MSYRPGTLDAVLVPLSVHLVERLVEHPQIKFELRLGDHVIWTEWVWAYHADPIDEAIAIVARRFGDLMRDGALYVYEED